MSGTSPLDSRFRASPRGLSPPRSGAWMATVAMIAGLLAFIPTAGIPLGLVGAALGIVAIVRKAPFWRRATAGIVLSIVGVFVAQQYILPFAHYSDQRAGRQACEVRLAALGRSIHSYLIAHPDRPVPTVDELVSRGVVDSKFLACPSGDEGSYFCLPARDDVNPRAFMACDYLGNHDHGRNVLLADGSVTWMEEAKFLEELYRSYNADFATGFTEAQNRRPPALAGGG